MGELTTEDDNKKTETPVVEAIAVESTGVSVEAVEVDEEQDGKLTSQRVPRKDCRTGRGSSSRAGGWAGFVSHCVLCWGVGRRRSPDSFI